jgi:GntR family transcriptional regulator
VLLQTIARRGIVQLYGQDELRRVSVAAPVRLSRLSPLPLHYQISEELRHDVVSGRLAPGTLLPSEADLAARFSVARGTIRQALATLRADGLLTGGRGKPPVVRGPRLAQPFSELLSFSAWVTSLGRKPAGRVIEFARLPADVETADALGVPRGTTVFHLVRVRLADDEPLMIERTTFPARVGELVAGLELDRQSIYAELAGQGIVFDAARQYVDAVAATATDALLLQVPRDSPLLRVRRLSFSPNGEPLERSEDRYVSDRVTLSIDNSAHRSTVGRQLVAG